uniref:Uncharacterized protein n=1 Tax=Strombidium inclinatum TaxID=197538 RepID=A0A7S3IGM2_9SPIT|mmetsp:Transcript_16189/g.25068  ORF Transcript_16189/g.25068 Transcript_16189/m.25068 type:complete len:181 (+) Transcript_16189:203-745(+)
MRARLQSKNKKKNARVKKTKRSAKTKKSDLNLKKSRRSTKNKLKTMNHQQAPTDSQTLPLPEDKQGRESLDLVRRPVVILRPAQVVLLQLQVSQPLRVLQVDQAILLIIKQLLEILQQLLQLLQLQLHQLLLQLPPRQHLQPPLQASPQALGPLFDRKPRKNWPSRRRRSKRPKKPPTTS